MDKEIDQSPDTQNMHAVQAVNAPFARTGASRRRFTRGAVLGGAVVLSLGNRAAWSTEVAPVCLSANTLASAANYATGTHASMNPVNQAKIVEYRRLEAMPEYTTVSDGNGGSCVVPKT